MRWYVRFFPLAVLFLASCFPSDVGLIPTPDIPTPILTVVATATIQAPPTNTPNPHLMKPNVGNKNEAIAHDVDERYSFKNRNISDADNFRANLFERPFTAGEMDYLPYLDIKDFSLTSDANWYFSRIVLSGMDKSNFVHGSYGAEFDLNKDGRAEILVFVENPFLDWSTDRVSVYLDGDGDIGGNGSTPDHSYTGNGYEVPLFVSGRGTDPDLAWARLENGTYPKINIAVKRSLFQQTAEFMWSVLSSEQPLDPAKFYFNDHFLEEQAGSPSQASEYYPIKELAGLDSTCRMPVGFEPTGREPMGCTRQGLFSVEWIPRDINWCKQLSLACPQE